MQINDLHFIKTGLSAGFFVPIFSRFRNLRKRFPHPTLKNPEFGPSQRDYLPPSHALGACPQAHQKPTQNDIKSFEV